MGYEHVVFNAGLYAGMVFYNLEALSWLDVLKNLFYAFIGNYIGGVFCRSCLCVLKW